MGMSAIDQGANDAGSADEAETVEESILHAKQAVSLDIKDGQSWCTISSKPLSDYLDYVCTRLVQISLMSRHKVSHRYKIYSIGLTCAVLQIP